MPGTLYKSDGSPPAMAVMMLANILELDLNLKDLNPVLREQDTLEFKKKNPMRTVPILEEGEFCLADSHAIMTYLIEEYGMLDHKNLYPENLRKRALINQRMYFECGILFQRLRAVMEPTFLGELTEVSKHQERKIKYAYRILEDYLSDTLYMADDVMTLADISVCPTITALHGLCPIDRQKYPKLTDWLERMSKEDFYIKIAKPGCQYLVSTLKYLMDSNKMKVKSKI